jgi:hypothetical protein
MAAATATAAATSATMLATAAVRVSGQGGARHKDQKRGTDRSVQDTHHTNSSSEPL